MSSVVHESQYNRRITDRGRPLGMYAALLGGQGLRVSWGGIWSGVLLSTGLLILLAALGAAIGISAVQPGESDASTFATGAGIYAAICLLAALFVGGWASTRLGGIWDRATGLCEGALVWVVSLLLMGYLAASGVTSLAGGAFKLVGGAAQTVGGVMQSQSGGMDVSGNVDQVLQRLRDPNTAQQIAQATGMPANEVQQSLGQTAQKVEAARDNPGQAAQEAKQGMTQLMERAKSSGALEQKAEEAKPAAAKAAWITLGALLLSLVCAVVGALAGRRDPEVLPAK